MLNYTNLFKNVVPRVPFNTELTQYPQRCAYWESFLVTFPIVFCMGFSISLQRFLFSFTGQNSKDFFFLFESIFVMLPVQIGVLDFPVKDYVSFTIVFCLLSTLISIFLNLASKSVKTSPCEDANMLPVLKTRIRNEISSTYRGSVYLSTALCIFARDIPTWNNLFSKSFSFGTGLMDVGLGCFIIIIGMNGSTAKGYKKADIKKSMNSRVLQPVIILTVCGIVNTAVHLLPSAIHGINLISSQTSEYGVHWNAFFSLAAAKLFGVLLEIALPSTIPPMVYGYFIGFIYEIILANGLAEFILTPGKSLRTNRDSYISMNKEGLSSVFGICSLYFFGVQIGIWLNAWNNSKSIQTSITLIKRLTFLLFLAIFYRAFLLQFPNILLPESRRLFNISYNHWILAFSAFMLLVAAILMLLCQVICGSTKSSIYINSVDNLGLVYFITSNLSTGLLNWIISLFYMNRELMPGILCFIILSVHMVLSYVSASVISKFIQSRGKNNQEAENDKI